MIASENETHTTADERRFVRELANADLLRINRIRNNFRLRPIDGLRLLELYTAAASVRSDWVWRVRLGVHRAGRRGAGGNATTDGGVMERKAKKGQ